MRLMFGELDANQSYISITEILAPTPHDAFTRAFELFLEIHAEDRREVSSVHAWDPDHFDPIRESVLEELSQLIQIVDESGHVSPLRVSNAGHQSEVRWSTEFEVLNSENPSSQ